MRLSLPQDWGTSATEHKFLRLFAFHRRVIYFYCINTSIMKNLKIFHLFAIGALFMFNSCGMIISSYIKKDTENIPPDFGKEKTTLLIVKHKNNYNKKVDKITKKYYTGDYMLVPKEELTSKYSDAENYRYILDDEITISSTRVTTITTNRQTGMSTPSSQVYSAGGRSFRIIDRKTEKTHDTGVSSGTSWKKILKTYLKKLESERNKNENK